MTLVDTGPLVALLDRDDSRHHDCNAALHMLPPAALLTTWPCFTEAMYLLGAVGGNRYQQVLWKLRAAGRLVIEDVTAPEADRMEELMQTYEDTPMDLADASLVVLAERFRLRSVFTLDGHFHIYRLLDGSVLEIVPSRRQSN